MLVKIIHWLGIVASIGLVIACFLPWTYFADPHIPTEAEKVFTGYYSFGNNYGKPGKLLTILAAISLLCMLVPKVWAKRTHLFVAALALGYAIKSYVLFTSCYLAYCPEKKVGIYLMMACTILMLVAAALPKLTIPSSDTKTA